MKCFTLCFVSFVYDSQVFDRKRIRNRYLQKDFLWDFIGVIPLDVLVYYLAHSGSYTVGLCRIPKYLHTRKLYTYFRTSYSERSSSSARLMADIQSLYCYSLAVLHILACLWYALTGGDEVFNQLGHSNFLGDVVTGDVSKMSCISKGIVFKASKKLNLTVFSHVWQDQGGPFAIRYYIYCVSVVTYVISGQGCPTDINGTPQEVWFLIFTIILNQSFWAYLMGSISGEWIVSILNSHREGNEPANSLGLNYIHCTLLRAAQFI